MLIHVNVTSLLPPPVGKLVLKEGQIVTKNGRGRCAVSSAQMWLNFRCLSPNADDEDHESVHEVMEDLAGSSATKKARARKILKSPSKKVSLDVLATFR